MKQSRQTTNVPRTLQRVLPARATQDGDGVKIHRVAGQALNSLLDPFLMLDEIHSDEAADYIGGFPPHPHRGFETITYMVQGRFRHRDSMGNEGVISSGGVQWMEAAHGVIHSEMPEQQDGELHGFQLWLNLPAVEKMKPASYQDIDNEQLGHYRTETGVKVTAIAGNMILDGEDISGYVQGKTTQPGIFDISIPAGQQVSMISPSEHQVLAYVFAGATEQIALQHMAAYGLGDEITLTGTAEGARILLLTGEPLREPVVQYGPFVMNTMAEINQAISDYQHNRLV